MANKASLNKVIIIGNFGGNPELRTLPNGNSVANFSVATTEVWLDKNTNNKSEDTQWHRITFFGRQAEIINQYGQKGGKIYIEGTLRTRKWTDKDGVDRYTTEIRGRDFTFLGNPNNGNGNGNSNDTASQNKSDDSNPAYDNDMDNFGGMDDDDIPF